MNDQTQNNGMLPSSANPNNTNQTPNFDDLTNGGMFTAPPPFVPVAQPAPVTTQPVAPQAAPVIPVNPVAPVNMNVTANKTEEIEDNPFFRVPKPTPMPVQPVQPVINPVPSMPAASPVMPAAPAANSEQKPFNPITDRIPEDIMAKMAPPQKIESVQDYLNNQAQTANVPNVSQKVENKLPDWMQKIEAQPVPVAQSPVPVTPVSPAAPAVPAAPVIAVKTVTTPVTAPVTTSVTMPVNNKIETNDLKNLTQPVTTAQANTAVQPAPFSFHSVPPVAQTKEVVTEPKPAIPVPAEIKGGLPPFAPAINKAPAAPAVENKQVSSALDKSAMKTAVADVVAPKEVKKNEAEEDHRVRDILLVLAVIILAVLALALGVALATNAIP